MVFNLMSSLNNVDTTGVRVWPYTRDNINNTELILFMQYALSCLKRSDIQRLHVDIEEDFVKSLVEAKNRNLSNYFFKPEDYHE